MFPKNMTENKITPCNTVHIYLIGPYTIKLNHTQPGGAIKEVDFHLTFMTFIDPSTGWLTIVEVPYYDSKEFQIVNTNYINKTYVRIIQFFNNTWMYHDPRPCRLVFNNGSEFKT